MSTFFQHQPMSVFQIKLQIPNPSKLLQIIFVSCMCCMCNMCYPFITIILLVFANYRYVKSSRKMFRGLINYFLSHLENCIPLNS